MCNQVRAHTGPPTDVWINSHNKIRTYIPDAKRVPYAPKHCQIKNNYHVFIQQHKIFDVISPFYIAENRTTHTQGILFLAHDNHHCLSHVTKTWPQSDHMTQKGQTDPNPTTNQNAPFWTNHVAGFWHQIISLASQSRSWLVNFDQSKNYRTTTNQNAPFWTNHVAVFWHQIISLVSLPRSGLVNFDQSKNYRNKFSDWLKMAWQEILKFHWLKNTPWRQDINCTICI